MCHHWMQKNMKDRWGTIAHEDMLVMDHATTSRTILQQIHSRTHHSVPARTIRRRLQLSRMPARVSLLRFSLTGNHRRLLHQ
ncbi:hypothetical protein TNCV_2671791 [Trichonephila clavipes]|nr:hypothetical protein TNCV_2671791 [Trichonephila clavipes]